MSTGQENDELNGLRSDLARADVMVARISVLKERMVSLEVDCIAADSAKRFRRDASVLDIPVETAAAIVLTLDRERRLGRDLSAMGPLASVDVRPLQDAGDALRTWLDADNATKDQTFSTTVRGVLMMVSLAGLLAGIFVHWAFLILLMPIGATSALMWSGNDSSWQRLGAKNRYQLSQLPEPTSWTEPDVRARLAELQAEIDKNLQPDVRELPSQERLSRLLDEIEGLNDELDLLLATVGLEREELTAELERQMRTFSEAYIAQNELREVQSELRRLQGESETIINRVYRYLYRHGQAPADGNASAALLRKGLDRLASG